MNSDSKTYQWIATEDGSKTLYSPLFDENCHSTTGALEETRHVYIQGNNVIERASEKGQISILEVGLGTGLGFWATWQALKEIPNLSLSYYALEIDPYMIENADPFGDQTKCHREGEFYLFKKDQFELKVIAGDARQSLPQHHGLKFDVIYQDAFSPRRNPALWTVQWFELLKKMSHANTTMTTYSSTKKMQKAMMEAGWFVTAMPGFGPKKWATKACASGSNDPELFNQLINVEAFSD